MSSSINAVYENGVLRPLTPLSLAEGQQVEIVFQSEEALPASKAASILAEIAALPIEGSGDPHTSRDHDKVLYGTRTKS